MADEEDNDEDHDEDYEARRLPTHGPSAENEGLSEQYCFYLPTVPSGHSTANTPTRSALSL